jgi:hypothetical protein
VTSLAALATACGSSSDPDPNTAAPPPSTVSGGPATSAAPAAPATTTGASPSAAGCPITVDALATATSLRWELRDRRENYQLETIDNVKATVCVFTAGAALQFGGDPLVFRTDVVTGAASAVVRQDFTATCASISGVVKASAGGSVCDRNGVVVEGMKGEGDRVVLASFVNADNSTATTLTPAFTKVLDAVR